MRAGVDGGERDVVVQVRGRGDDDRIQLQRQQFVDIGDRLAAEEIRDLLALGEIGIGDADQQGTRQVGQYARMVRSHDTDADDADTDRRPCRRNCALSHLRIP